MARPSHGGRLTADRLSAVHAPDRVRIVAPAGAGGIRRSAEDLAAALGHLMVGADVVDRPGGDGPAHFHYGNSCRSVLRPLARRRGDVVTVHDVLPRNRLLRACLPPAVGAVLRRHHLVAHSDHAARLLAGMAPGARPDVVPLLLAVPSPPAPSPLGPPDGRPSVVLAGRLRAVKGVAELVEAAAARPALRLTLVGAAADRRTAALLGRLPANVCHLDRPDHTTFMAALAGADVVVSWRPDSVGETSGPVVEAHQLGTPVAGLATGSLPEYCGPGDVLVAPGTPAGVLLDAVLAAPLGRIPAGDARRRPPEDVAARYVELYRRHGLLPG